MSVSKKDGAAREWMCSVKYLNDDKDDRSGDDRVRLDRTWFARGPCAKSVMTLPGAHLDGRRVKKSQATALLYLL